MTDTMNINSYTYNVFYVDSTLLSGGTGLTPATAISSPAISSAAFPISGFATNSLYLFRNTSTPTVIFPNPANTNANIILMGMPISGSYEYNLLPSTVTATSAWGGDTATQSTIQVYPNTTVPGLTFNGTNCSIRNLQVLGAGGINYASGVVAFNNNYPSLVSSIVGISGVPLSGASAINSGFSTVGISVSGAGANIRNNFIFSNNANAVSFTMTNSSDNDFVNFADNTLYTRRQNTSSLTGINFASFSSASSFIKINNNTINLDENNAVSSNTDTGISMPVARGQIDISDLIINILNESSNGGTFTGLSLTGSNVTAAYGDTRLTRVTVNANSSTRTVQGLTLSTLKKLNLDTINVNAAATTSSTSYGGSVSSSINYKATNMALNIGSGTTQCFAFKEDTNCERSCVSNSLLNSSGYAFNGNRADIVNCSGSGAFSGGGDSMHFVSLTDNNSTIAPYITVTNPGSNNSVSPVLYIQSLNAVGVGTAPAVTTNGVVLVDTLSGASVGAVTTSQDYSKLYINNMGTANLWYHESSYDKMFSSLTSRTSGNNNSGFTGFSIRCQGKQLDSTNSVIRAGVIAPRPYDGKSYTFATSGNKRMTWFIGSKSMTPLPSGATCWVELIVPDGSTGSLTKVLSSHNHSTYMTDSTSGWTEAGLSQQQIVLDFNLEQSGNVYWRFYYHFYQNGTEYLYFDPTPYVQEF